MKGRNAVKPRMAVAALAALGLFVSVAVANDRRSFIIFSGAATDTTAVGMADSSSVLYTREFQRLYLDLKPNRPCRVAILVKAHGDTLGGSGVVANTDTSKTFIWPWRTVSSAANTDSMSYKETNLPTSVQAGSEELIYEFADNGVKKWSPSRGRVIPLRSPVDGTWYWAENTSIRLRVLTAGGAVTWKCVLRGVSW